MRRPINTHIASKLVICDKIKLPNSVASCNFGNFQQDEPREETNPRHMKNIHECLLITSNTEKLLNKKMEMEEVEEIKKRMMNMI